MAAKNFAIGAPQAHGRREMTGKDIHGREVDTVMLSVADAPTIKNAIRKRLPKVTDIEISQDQAHCHVTTIIDIDGVVHMFQSVDDNLRPMLDREFYHADLLNVIDRWIEDGKNIAAEQSLGNVAFTKEEEKWLREFKIEPTHRNLTAALLTSTAGVF